jgi:homoserine O-acetyltransferase
MATRRYGAPWGLRDGETLKSQSARPTSLVGPTPELLASMSVPQTASQISPAPEGLPEVTPETAVSSDHRSGGIATHAGVVEIPGQFDLHFGGSLPGLRIAWQLTGPASAPVVAALGGISAGRYVTGTEPPGWWSDLAGPGRALDTDRWRVLGMDFLGGSGGTTGPAAGDTRFPTISSCDQGRMLHLLMQHLGIAQLHAIVGASYGGMVALAFAEAHAASVQRIVAISAADRTHPMSTAWRSVQRAMVRYAMRHDQAAEGLRLARALAMTTYRSPAEFAARFAGPAELVEGRFQFPVERYLLSRGDAYVASHLPESFVCLSESIDLHRVDAAAIRVPVTLVAVREDQIVPLADMHALRQRLGGPSELFELSSHYGHDAFLKEVETLRTVFTRALL